MKQEQRQEWRDRARQTLAARSDQGQAVVPAPQKQFKRDELRAGSRLESSGRSATGILAGIAALTLCSATAAAQGHEVTWQGEEHATSELPAMMDSGAKEAVQAWAPWAEAQGYRLDLSDDGRVLLLVEGKRLPRKTWKLVESSLAAYDELLPPLGGLEVATRNASANRSEADAKILPTAVLVQIDDEEDYASLLGHLTEMQPYLEEWAAGASRGVGFTLERPLVAAWQTKPDGVDEWDPKNELVHRLGTLLVSRDHGRMPHWLARGLAWSLEIEVERDVACFPGRDSFVYAVEHGSWPSTAKNLARKLGKKSGVRLEALASWERGTWDDDLAVLSWGCARWMAIDRPGLLPVILAELENARIEGSTTRYPDGSWTTDGSYSLDAEAQRAILARHLGEDFEDAWTAALSGKRR